MSKVKLWCAAISGALILGGGSHAIAQDMPGKGTTIRPVEAPALEEKFQHKILYRVLEELGYEIAEPQEVEYQTMHLVLGTGDGDFTAVHWDPLHLAFFEESGGDAALTRVGDYIAGALQGYLVDTDSYNAGIKNLGDLTDAAVAQRFDADGDGKADLAGCAPGWGCERVIEHHLTEFGLRDTVAHNQGAYNAIMADTIARLEAGESIVYYTWTPYWVSGVLVPGDNVQWVEVPYSSLPDDRTDNTVFNGMDLGFAVNSIRVVANNDFLANNPVAAKLFEVAKLDINDISAQNKTMADGEDSIADIDRHVAEWIAEHRSEVDSWLQAARAAAN